MFFNTRTTWYSRANTSVNQNQTHSVVLKGLNTVHKFSQHHFPAVCVSVPKTIPRRSLNYPFSGQVVSHVPQRLTSRAMTM